jgi:AcrR family transcriptional regulator
MLGMSAASPPEVPKGSKRRRGRPPIPSDVQRQRLIDAALRVLEKNRYERATVADIVREAGTSSRSFYEHFAAKEDVLAEIVRLQADRLFEELAGIFTASGASAATAGQALRAYLQLFPAGTVDLERLGGEAGQRVREVRRGYVEKFTDLVLEQFRQAHQQGRIPRAPERPEIELVLMGIEALSFRYYSEGRRYELLALHPLLRDVLLRALF